jgi:GNAT superfamily N-acetyltransferase
MQIREMDLKELYEAYEILHQLRNELSYKEFEDLIYEMRHMEYKMFGLFERKELITFAGVAIETTLAHKRHLHIFDLVTDEKQRFLGYAKLMLEFLEGYAKTAMCENLVLSNEFSKEDAEKFYEKNDFTKTAYSFVRRL